MIKALRKNRYNSSDLYDQPMLYFDSNLTFSLIFTSSEFISNSISRLHLCGYAKYID